MEKTINEELEELGKKLLMPRRNKDMEKIEEMIRKQNAERKKRV